MTELTDHERATQWLNEFRTHVKEVLQNDPEPDWVQYDAIAIAHLTQHFREVRYDELKKQDLMRAHARASNSEEKE